MQKILKRNVLEKILFVFLCMQVILIAYVNFSLMENNIDCDSAKLFVHAIEMWRNGTPFIPGWEAVSTLELDCATLLAVPLFGLTNNIYIAFSISNLVFLVLLISTIFYMFDGEKNKLYPLVSAILVCIPYRIGMLDYFNMMYFNGAQYIIKVTIPLLLLALLLHSDDIKKEKKSLIKFIVFATICGILLFVSVLSSGIYVLLCGVLPMFVASFLWRTFQNKKITISYSITAISALAIAGIGYIMNHILEIGAKGSSMNLRNIYEGLVDNINACFLAIFEVFGGVAYSEVPVMSYNGISILVRMVFVIILLLCAVGALIQIIKKEASEVVVGLLAVFAWNVFILSICDTQYGASTFEYRYHLIGLIPLMCLSSKMAIGWIEKYRQSIKIGFTICGILLIAVMMFTSYKNIFTKEDPNVAYKEICKYADEIGVDYVYFLFQSEQAEICRLIDHENALYLQLMGTGETSVIDYYKIYNQAPMIRENFIVICDYNFYDPGEKMEMFGYVFERTQTIGTNNIYEVIGFVE